MKIGHWDIDILDEKYISRLEKAKSAHCTPLGVEKNVGFAVFSGAHGIYNTTLEKCNCYDNASSSYPCKHIIRLAIELGLIQEPYESDLSKVIYPTEYTEKMSYVNTMTGEVTKSVPKPEGALYGMTFTLTGDEGNKLEISSLIANNGGKVSGSVSHKTSYLINLGGQTSSKISRAKELNVPIIGTQELLDIIGK